MEFLFTLSYKLYPFYALGRYWSNGFVLPFILTILAGVFFSTIGKFWGFYCYIADIITIIFFFIKGEFVYAVLGLVFIALNLLYNFVLREKLEKKNEN